MRHEHGGILKNGGNPGFLGFFLDLVVDFAWLLCVCVGVYYEAA